MVKRVKSVIRENDIIVRYGGDEFVVLLPNSNISNARKLARKIIQNIGVINEMEKKEFDFNISIGVSEYRNKDKDIDSMLKRADEALYKAKNEGKNCVR